MIDMDCITKIEWEDIYDALEEILSFIGWDNKMKFLWVEKAWSCVNSAGLTSYTTDIEKHIVYIRLYTALSLYCEFISIAMETEYSLDGDEWVSQFNLNPFRLGQLVGQVFEPQEEEDNVLLNNAMDELSSLYKDDVLRVLLEGFGGLSSLFTSLWLTHDNSFTEDYYESNEDDLMDVTSLLAMLDIEEYDKMINKYKSMIMNNDLNSNKLRLYEWLKEQVY